MFVSLRSLTIRINWFLLVVVLAAVAAAWPALSESGLLNTRGGGDSPFLLQRLHQLVTAVSDGHFPVRWMPDANYGFGYPFFNFYAPLSIYIAALFRFIGFSLVRSIHLAQLAGFVTAAVGMFYLARRWFGSEWAGLLATVAYTFAPFHLVNVYVRGDSLAEFWAMAFYPLLILAADSVVSEQLSVGSRWRGIAWFALAYAALILSHNISALIFSPFLILYIVLRWLSQKRQSPISNFQSPLPILAGMLLAFALAAWFFVPALAEKGLAQLGPITEGFFHFSNHFLGTPQHPLVQSSFFFDYAVNGRRAFSMGLVQAVLVGLGVIVLLLCWRRDERPRPYQRLFILISLLISTFMLLPVANVLWEVIPLLSFTQFPWRFLSVQAFVGALAVGALACLPWRKIVVPVTAVLLIIAAYGRLETDHLILTDADITGEKLAQYEWFTGNIGTTVSFEYLPHTVQPRPYTSRWLLDGARYGLTVLTGELNQAELVSARTVSQVWRVDAAVPSALVFPTLNWPGWEVMVDGEAVKAQFAPGSGLIMLLLAEGEHDISLHLARTPVRLLAEWVSLVAVLVTLWLLRPSKWKQAVRPFVYTLAIFILLILSAKLEPERPLSDDDLTWDFEEMAYLHHDVAGVPFSNGLTLRDYQYDLETLSPSVDLTVTTHWQGVSDLTPELTLFLTTPAANWVFDPSPPIFALATAVIEDGQAIFHFTLPDNIPTGLIVPRLSPSRGHPLTPSGRERGEVYLRPLPIQPSPQANNIIPQIDVRAVQAQLRTPTILDVQLAWLTQEPLSRNYNAALRLTDANGNFLRLADRQPGYGFQPSSSWPVGQWVNDWQAIDFPEERHQTPYVLVAQLYDVAAPETAVLTRRLGELVKADGGFHFQPTEPRFSLPDEMEQVTAVFGNTIALRGYTLTQTNQTLNITFVWEALTPSSTDYIRFVHLIPAHSDKKPVAQVDSMPRSNTYPTSQWMIGEIISDSLTLKLDIIPSGNYEIAVGFYEHFPDGSLPRLTAVGPANTPLPDNRFLLPQTIPIP
ncbi:MAG: hypothetical protein GY796_29705 [Chloroflexi bacterium]|nr:hypothetical protein [Chloroflexota bacterium]